MKIKVKPLEWVNRSKYTSTADTILGMFYAEQDIGGRSYYAFLAGIGVWQVDGLPSMEAAQSACQGEHASRILAVIEIEE